MGFSGANFDPWYSEDALHCRTKGIFDKDMIHISHKSIRTNELFTNNINVEVEIIDYGNNNAEMDRVLVYWKYSDNDGPYIDFDLNFDGTSDNGLLYSAQFPIINVNAEIEYYIEVQNNIGDVVKHPIAGWHNFKLENISGDINQDSLINIQDVILLINDILNDNFSVISDINNDGQLDVLDVVLLINLILD